MRTMALFAVLIVLLAGCAQTGNPGSGNNTTNSTTNNTIPAGYEVKDYCQKDSDCVRLGKCCDCGLGEYVNRYNQQSPDCTGPRCLCPIAASEGRCMQNKCVAVAVKPPNGFCGWFTNGSCASDSDCISGGCSGQVCQSAAEDPVITTCEYKDCYNPAGYGVSCGCASGKCQWR